LNEAKTKALEPFDIILGLACKKASKLNINPSEAKALYKHSPWILNYWPYWSLLRDGLYFRNCCISRRKLQEMPGTPIID
jgi:hypothetical protein